MAKNQTQTPTNGVQKQPSLWQRIKKARWAYAFISPFYILFAIFSLYPLLLSIYLSFTRWKGVGPMRICRTD